MEQRTTDMMDLKSIQLDFLWYSYFGINRIDGNATGEEKELALISCIHRAYRDANRKMQFHLSEGKIRISKDKNKVNEYKELKAQFSPAAAWKKEPKSVELILGHIQTLLSDSNEEYSQSSFDSWHNGTCTCIKEYAVSLEKNGMRLFDSFSYGLAQKWINMTLKYMLIMGLWNKELCKKAQWFHVPIDSIIIKKVKENWESQLNAFWTIKHWYELDDSCMYLKFQNLIREKLNLGIKSPIEWEAYEWIKKQAIPEKKEPSND